ncbi:DUF4411 family protein [Cellulosimicrobium funkei]|uniref:DUF4411 family protein n=1 Tax=Cellulosimicrobium funkei TaxID=264251 RepID=UPI003438069F
MYLLDSNVMIEAKNRYYGFDICPGFWDWLEQSHAATRIFSINAVRDEIAAGEDELSKWAKSLPPSFFINRGAGTVPHLTALARWAAASAQYTDAAKAEFLAAADYYLVAQAREHNFALVTHELPSNSKRRIKIPEAARELGVRIMSPFDVMRAEGAKFSM